MSGVSVTRTVPLDPAAAWARVADVVRTAELSDEVQRVEWTRRREHERPNEGDRFLAHNRLGGAEWSVESVVTEAEPGRSFAFSVHSVEQPTALWRFDLALNGTGTQVTYSVEIGPGPSMMKAVAGDDAELLARMTAWRLGNFEEGMTRLLDSLR